MSLYEREKLLDGDPKSVVAHYQRLLYAPPEAAAHVRAEIAAEREEIEAGAGVPVQVVNRLLNQFEQMQKMMKMMKGGNMACMMRGLKGALPGMR